MPCCTPRAQWSELRVRGMVSKGWTLVEINGYLAADAIVATLTPIWEKTGFDYEFVCSDYHAACRGGIIIDAVVHHHGPDGQVRQAPAGRKAVYPQMARDDLGGKQIPWVICRNMATNAKIALCFAEPLAAWPPERLRSAGLVILVKEYR
jgi:hypothetical protein